MRRLVEYTLVAALTILATRCAAPAAAQSEGPTPYEPGLALLWDHTGLDVEGFEEHLDHFRVTTYRSGVVGIHSEHTVSAAARQVDVAEVLSGAPGGTYELYLRAVDVAGNESERAGPVEVEWDGVAPTMPLNLRLEITVTATVETPSS